MGNLDRQKVSSPTLSDCMQNNDFLSICKFEKKFAQFDRNRMRVIFAKKAYIYSSLSANPVSASVLLSIVLIRYAFRSWVNVFRATGSLFWSKQILRNFIYLKSLLKYLIFPLVCSFVHCSYRLTLNIYIILINKTRQNKSQITFARNLFTLTKI